jgi:hypothetical protein
MLGPTLAPLVPWQPAQVFDNMAGVELAAHSEELAASPPASKTNLISLRFIVPPFFRLFVSIVANRTCGALSRISKHPCYFPVTNILLRNKLSA